MGFGNRANPLTGGVSMCTLHWWYEPVQQWLSMSVYIRGDASCYLADAQERIDACRYEIHDAPWYIEWGV
jgi:hypothetical protein